MSFEIETGIVKISDPKFSESSWKSLTLPNCRIGNWTPTFEKINDDIIAFTATYNNIYVNSWSRLDCKIIIDSGLIGIYDEKYYRDDYVVPDDFDFKIKKGIIVSEFESGHGKWFDMNYLQAKNENQWAIISFGCVLKINKSVKVIYTHKTKKEVDGIRLSFYE